MHGSSFTSKNASPHRLCEETYIKMHHAFFVAIFSCLKNELSKGNPIRTISLRNARMLGQVYHHVTSISLRRQTYKVFLRHGRSGGVHFSSERLSLASTNCQRGGTVPSSPWGECQNGRRPFSFIFHPAVRVITLAARRSVVAVVHSRRTPQWTTPYICISSDANRDVIRY